MRGGEAGVRVEGVLLRRGALLGARADAIAPLHDAGAVKVGGVALHRDGTLVATRLCLRLANNASLANASLANASGAAAADACYLLDKRGALTVSDLPCNVRREGGQSLVQVLGG